MSEETTENSVATATITEAAEAAPGVGGTAGVPTVTTLNGLVNVIQSQQSMLVNSNKRNADLFNHLQEFITEKTTGVTQLDGAISAISGFVNEDTPADDEHVLRLTELQTERSRTVEELQNADTQRRNVFNSITMTEGALQILAQVLSTAGLSQDTEAAAVAATDAATAEDATDAVAAEEGASTEAE